MDNYYNNDELYHHGILGQKWGVRRYQNEDGTLTTAGKRRAQKEGKHFYNREISSTSVRQLDDNKKSTTYTINDHFAERAQSKVLKNANTQSKEYRDNFRAGMKLAENVYRKRGSISENVATIGMGGYFGGMAGGVVAGAVSIPFAAPVIAGVTIGGLAVACALNSASSKKGRNYRADAISDRIKVRTGKKSKYMHLTEDSKGKIKEIGSEIDSSTKTKIHAKEKNAEEAALAAQQQMLIQQQLIQQQLMFQQQMNMQAMGMM